MLKVVLGLLVLLATSFTAVGTARAQYPDVKDTVRSEDKKILSWETVFDAQNGFVYTADIDGVESCVNLRWEQWIKGSVTLEYGDGSTLVLDMCRDVLKAATNANAWCDDTLRGQKKGPKDVNRTERGDRNYRCTKDKSGHLLYTFEDAPGRNLRLNEADPRNGKKKLSSASFAIEVEQKLWYKFDGDWEYFWSTGISLDGVKTSLEDSRRATITFQGRH